MQMTEYRESKIEREGTAYALVRVGEQKLLRVHGNTEGFSGTAFQQEGASYLPLSAGNAAQLRQRLPWLVPQPLPPQTSFGFGDRLGLATPGHIQAVRQSGIFPIFAQQSVRENARTGRTPQQVVDDALWGVFQAGWRAPWGADADHLKTPADLAPFVAAGYTLYTIDPGAHVDNTAIHNTSTTLAEKVKALPWETLHDSPERLRARYVERTFVLNGMTLTFREETLLRAAAKYGRAVAHTVVMAQAIAGLKHGDPFDLEVSVDETETPTWVEEHFYVANELQRLGVRVGSLAPRLVGRFEKGVDYIGDLATLARNLDEHARIARHFQYRLSLHSGSDKVSVYPLLAASTRGFAHVKTAGTSYLEALRTIAHVNPQLFREILTLARTRYPLDRASYHVSAELTRVRDTEELADAQLPDLLNEFNAREVLHVTFGSVLAEFGKDIHTTLGAHEDEYATALQTHFAKHLAPFAALSYKSQTL
ncbi:MAG TPA: tagaturonate epimerase family protein [Anaerolineae bacterium]|nr:tagaturonate epimerase family protein [Anaerolineae bacterium]